MVVLRDPVKNVVLIHFNLKSEISFCSTTNQTRIREAKHIIMKDKKNNIIHTQTKIKRKQANQKRLFDYLLWKDKQTSHFFFFRSGSNSNTKKICGKAKIEHDIDLVDFQVKKAFINVFYFMENHDV